MTYDHCLFALYGELWAIHPDKFAAIEAAFWTRVQTGQWAADAPQASVYNSRTPDDYHGGVAVVRVRGTLTNRPSLFSSGGSSAEHLGRKLDAAKDDPSVRAVLLDIDSPGGQVAGIPELAAKIRQVREAKPVHAVANTMAASAAYWLGSQAGTLAVAPSGEVGSIGVISQHVDQSRMLDKQGVTVSLVTSGRFKGEGNPYQPLSDEARAERQRRADLIYGQFVRDVGDGRRVNPERAAAAFGQGRMVEPEAAVQAGMADRIATFEQVLGELVQAHSRKAAATAHAAAAKG